MIFFLQYSTKGCRMVKLKILIRVLSRFNNFFDANNRGFLHNRNHLSHMLCSTLYSTNYSFAMYSFLTFLIK